eukprot:12902661-Prorocentrum_lima.AAC.1
MFSTRMSMFKNNSWIAGNKIRFPGVNATSNKLKSVIELSTLPNGHRAPRFRPGTWVTRFAVSA